MLRHVRVRVGAVLAVLSLAGWACIGQENVSEGDRCNPLASHNDCASGLICTGQGGFPSIPFCPENYCCSVDSNGNINSSNPNCQPGCNGGAASICTADKDPGACLLADGGTLAAATAADMPPPEAGTGDDGGSEGGTPEAGTPEAAVEAATPEAAVEAATPSDGGGG